ncbi:MaoC family dehydratase [Phenylobacterium sp. LH3H17]|uniref:MaoC family dehydratase n=1 Tax=Phenylobacterium sp. LH3H17 TaxID=2903901 RepID=UPI0020C984FB|nr:MaoC family dehydratase [Phenylobacterium sp. LH3H17]UTP38310.1 MaoC family dehydratase [Phenylobacterium sp. LH3H17]
MTEAVTQDVLSSLEAGDDIGTSDWLVVTQEMIDAFGAVTRDPDPMHIDPHWAAANGPYGGAIAFGFLTVSLLTHLLFDAMHTSSHRDPSTMGHYLNYGFDRLRLVSPVPAGARIRGRFTTLSRRQDDKERWITTFGCTIEIEGGDRPALVADWLSIWMPPEPVAGAEARS